MKDFSGHVRVELLNRRKKDLSNRKILRAQLASRSTWQSAVQSLRKPWKTFFVALVIQTTTSQLLFYPFVYARRYFVTVFKLVFLSVITGRSCCLVTNQCCHFWFVNVRSVVLREICEVRCIADKFDFDWAKLVLFSTFPLLWDARNQWRIYAKLRPWQSLNVRPFWWIKC